MQYHFNCSDKLQYPYDESLIRQNFIYKEINVDDELAKIQQRKKDEIDKKVKTNYQLVL